MLLLCHGCQMFDILEPFHCTYWLRLCSNNNSMLGPEFFDLTSVDLIYVRSKHST